jgi:hypothetical protein
MSGKIFISYRRGDGQDITARLIDRLKNEFGQIASVGVLGDDLGRACWHRRFVELERGTRQ